MGQFASCAVLPNAALKSGVWRGWGRRERGAQGLKEGPCIPQRKDPSSSSAKEFRKPGHRIPKD